MKYLSVCSGIEAATVAWHPLGWEPFAFAEIEKFPSAVLAHHYPSVPNLGDMTKFKDWPDADIDVLVGGTPCQSFSIAGLRQGLADPRGNLCLTFLAIADKYRPEWLLWENVPGVLSSDGGRDFGAFLGGLGQLGYGWSYRVLDAQYVRVDGFGRAVPQRRRRVFVVGNSRDWRRTAAVLFERESLQGHTPPRREAGQGTSAAVAPSIVSSGRGTQRIGETRGQDPVVAIAFGGNNTSGAIEVATAVQAHGGPHGRQDFGSETFVVGTGRGTPLVPIDLRQASRGEKITNNRAHGSGGAPGHGVGEIGDPAFTISERGQAVAYSITPSNSNEDYNARIAEKAQAVTGNGNRPSARGGDVIAFAQNQRGELVTSDVMGALKVGGGKPGQGYPAVAFDMRGREGGAQLEGPHDTANIRAASVGSSRSYVAQSWAVRRLTPIECERLQGFPDEYTQIPWRGKNGSPDGPRYKSLGNSMAVNAMRWLGRRIDLVSTLSSQEKKT